MCPDLDLLSAFVDGEVPSPWKERIEAHIKSCASCAAKVEEYRKLDAFLVEERRGFDSMAATDRVRNRLGSLLDQPVPGLAGKTSRHAADEAPKNADGAAPAETDAGIGGATDSAGAFSDSTVRRRGGLHLYRTGALWGQNVVIPVPLAAAAALAIMLLAGFLVAAVVRTRSAAPVQTLAAAEIKPGSNQSDSMEALVSYLESQNAQVNVTIQLPASSSGYNSNGKPLVVTASNENAPFSETEIESAGSIKP